MAILGTGLGTRSLFLLVCLALAGCQTLSKKHSAAVETREALTSVAGGLAGRPLSEEEARALERQIKTDPEAQEAIRKIATSMSEAPKSKYCPVDGARYAPHLEICPVHKVRLMEINNDKSSVVSPQSSDLSED